MRIVPTLRESMARCSSRSRPGWPNDARSPARPQVSHTNYQRTQRPCGVPPFPDGRARERADRELETGVCLRASMHLDATYGRHLLLPHPVSEPGAAQDLIQELSVAVSRTSADHLKLTYRLSADLGALKLPEPRPLNFPLVSLWFH